MAYLLIYICGFIILFFSVKKRGRAFGPASIVILAYILIGLISLNLYLTDGQYFNKLTFFPFLYLFTMVYLMLYSGIRYEKCNVERIQCPSLTLIQVFLFVYAVCSIVILPHQLAHIKDGLQILFASQYGGSELYADSHDVIFEAGGVSGLYGLFAIFHNFFSEIAIFTMFYYMTLPKKNKILLYLLFVAFFVEIISPIAEGQRTNCIMVSFSVLLSYFIFRHYWSQKTYKILRGLLITSIIVISVPFLALSISRFGRTDAGTVGSMVSYVGQADLNFNINCLDVGDTRHGDRTANQFKMLLGMETTKGIMDTRAKYSSRMKIDDGNFYTFVGDFTLDYGPFWGAIILITISLFFISITRPQKRSINFYQLLVIYLSLSIALKGSMYLFTYSFFGNYVLIAYFLMYLLLKLDQSQQKIHRYIEKQN